MKLIDIDSVVHSSLIHLDLPIHWYVPVAQWGLSCLRDLNFDVLMRTRKIRITLDDYGEYDLSSIGTDDVVDVVGVRAEIGGLLRKLPRSRNVNKKILLDDGMSRIQYPPTYEGTGYVGDYPYGSFGFRFYSLSTARGEHKGRLYGAGHLSEESSWWWDWERDVVGVWSPSTWCQRDVELEYLDYNDCNLGTIFPSFAASSIEKYIEWQYKSRSRNHSRFEVSQAKGEYYNERRILKARIHNLNINDFRKAARRYRRAVPNW